MELNPNHPVTEKLHDHWHKMLALVMFKLDVGKVTITPEDVEAFQGFFGQMSVVICESKGDDLQISLVGYEESSRLVKDATGKPC